MHDELWPRIDARFREVVGLPPRERDAALADLDAADPDVASRVRRLLSRADRADDTFDRLQSAAAGVLSDALEAREEQTMPADGRIGTYRVEERIGRGGSGSVYRAERIDGVYEQQVAIKVLRRGLDTDDLLDRFDAERRIMAALEHPRIARLLDGGSLPDGRPYLVMEYVRGRPIDEFCTEGRLSLRERLDLFLQVCEAVSFAHRALVLHRDLKPSNILVTADGQVKLLDFGIAKLLDDESPLVGPTRTRTGVRLLTPEYGAPEQVRGQPVSVATDVYQLGVLLHRILTAASPYDVGPESSMEDLHGAITGGRITPPSRASGAPGGVDPRGLRGDVDTILLKAMRTEPERRYGSVDAFAADVRAHLGGFPVTARPDSLGYRTGKLIRRNRVAAGASALAGLLLVALSLVSLSYATTSAEQVRLIETERDRAEFEAVKAAEVTSYLTTLFEAVDPSEHGGEALSARTLLDRGVARIDRLEAAPRLRAGLLMAMGDAFLSLSAPAEAEPLYRQAVELYRGQSSGPDPDVAEALNNLGHAMRSLGDRDAAMGYYRQALDLRTALYGEHHPDVACSLNNIGLVHAAREDYGTAADYYQRALAMRETYVGRQSDCIATILRNKAIAVRALGEYEEALAAGLEAREILEARGETVTPDYAATLTSLGRTERHMGNHDTAERLYRQAIELEERLNGEDSPRVAVDWNNLGVLLESTGRYEEAEVAHRRALAIRVARYGEHDRRVANSLGNLGAALYGLGRYEEADRVLARAIGLHRELRGDRSTWTASGLFWHGRVLAGMGRLDAAEARLRESVEIRLDVLGEDHERTRLAVEQLEEVRRRKSGV